LRVLLADIAPRAFSGGGGLGGDPLPASPNFDTKRYRYKQMFTVVIGGGARKGGGGIAKPSIFL
ncbi:MAG: hypothetical protein ABIJ65_03125, partial [Chloroflexota bacterium]